MDCAALPGRLYQSVPGFENHLLAELQKNAAGFSRIGPLVHDTGSFSGSVFWHQNCWLSPFRLEFSSINEAASHLREIQRNWAACPHACFRRASLIASKLPPISAKPHVFPWQPGDSPVGAWLLLDEHTMVASATCTSPFPNGAVEFEQDREGPPSRAYIKLWEALARFRRQPAAGERCLDLGASPGGWTWALAKLGANVLAVDQAPLEDRIASLPGVECLRRDAFTLKPQDVGKLDWLFCDVACYPSKLYGLIEDWLASGLCRNFICTIKMQGNVAGGKVDFETPKRFAQIPGSTVVHLYHNKHELTWMYSRDR